MSYELKIRRGTAAQHNTFVGADGEITFNTDTKLIHAHDGVKPGGHVASVDSVSATLIDYMPRGAGAVVSTVESKLRESVSILDFGGVPDSRVSAAINAAALNAAFAACKSVYIPEGTFYFNATVNMPIDAQLFGAGRIISRLVYTGANIALNLAGGYTHIQDVFLRGNSTAPRVFDAGTTGIYSNVLGGVLTVTSSRIQGFATLVDGGPVGVPPIGGGGFYWKFYDVRFTYADIVMSNISSNNLAFFGCSFSELNQGIQSYGGSGGPISFFGCSFEAWSGTFIGPVLGGILQLVMHGCYVENYPETNTTGSGLNPMTAAFLIAGEFSTISFIGNNVQCKGIRRVLFNTYADDSVITSENNLFYVNTSLGTSTTEALYLTYGGAAFRAMDTVISTADSGGTYTTTAVPANTTRNIFGINPLTRNALATPWTEITPNSGWQNSGIIGFPTLACKVENGLLFLRGQVRCLDITGTTIGTVPAEILAKLVSSTVSPTVFYLGTMIGINDTGDVWRFRLITSTGAILVGTPTVGTFDILSTPWSINT